jgi:pyruvate,water dikinase
LDAAAAAARMREATRSEMTRMFGVLRALAVRAGALTGLGDGIFYLALEEMVDGLRGDASAAAFIPARRETHARYSALPPYPSLIRGRFDPLAWAADPQRRSDLFDAQAGPRVAAPDSATLTGYAGAAGVVEGTVRVLRSVEEGPALQAGEVLVATTTNIGWSPLFPRAAAVVTDVGAPLSHAAIVARELGIPAVVGCGQATMRLRTGDRVRVNGGQGTVTVLG